MAAHTGSPPGPGLSRQGRQSRPRLDPDHEEYFRRALETLEEGLSEEELALFIPSVLTEATRPIPSLPLHSSSSCSLLLLQLLPRAPPGPLPALLLSGLPPTHPRGSRLLQAALGRLLALLAQGTRLSPELEGALGALGRSLGRDLGALARDPNGSFVLRALLGVLGGGGGEVPPPKGAEPKAKKAGPKAKEAWSLPEGVELPASFRPLLEELAQGLEQEMPTLLTPPCASLCLQGALSALHRSQSPSCARFCRALIGCLSRDCPAQDQSPLLTSLHDPARSRLLEAAMTVLDPPGLRELFRGHLRGHLRGVATHRVANHGLQRLLDHAPEDVVSEVLSEVGPALGEVLARGHPGVVTALLGSARRHAPLQGEALRWLFQALRCWDPPRHPRCVTALAQLRPLEGGDDKEGAEPEPLPALSLWGSLALQQLLHFGDPSPVLGALGALPPPALLGLCRSPPGSRLWGALLSSPSVPRKAQKRLLGSLKFWEPQFGGFGAVPEPPRQPPLGGAAQLPQRAQKGPETPPRQPQAPNFEQQSPSFGSPSLGVLGLCRSPPGSRLWGALLSSPSVPRKAQKRLLGSLKGHWGLLARDRSGSRVLDSAWAWAGPRHREEMAQELAPLLAQLRRDGLGRGAARRLNLELFLRDRKGWSQTHGGRGRKGRGLKG